MLPAKWSFLLVKGRKGDKTLTNGAKNYVVKKFYRMVDGIGNIFIAYFQFIFDAIFD